MRTHIIFAVAVICLASAALAEAPYQVAWSAQIGTSTFDQSRSVAVDASGNVYVSGYTHGDLGGPLAGARDAFLTKLDGSGNVLWSRQIGTVSDDASFAVAVDSSGNAYISGYTSGSLGGPNAGDWDAFLTKYDGSGNELWSRQIGTVEYDASYAVAVDSSGNAYITGVTYGDLAGPNGGQGEAFLTKYDASGDELWSRQSGRWSSKNRSVTVDASGDVYVSGENGDPGDASLTKYDASGNELWSQQVGTTASDWSQSVAVDAAGNAYITGHTYGDLGGTNAGGNDAFLTKWDESGNELWSRQVGSSETDVALSVAVDAAGNAYITGYTTGDLGGPNAGSLDAFLAKFDGSGNELWLQQIGTSYTDKSHAVVVDADGNPYISGWTEGSLGGPSAGLSDAFLFKYEVPEPASLSLLATAGLGALRRRRK